MVSSETSLHLQKVANDSNSLFYFIFGFDLSSEGDDCDLVVSALDCKCKGCWFKPPLYHHVFSLDEILSSIVSSLQASV